MSNVSVKIEKQGNVDVLTVSIPILKRASHSGKTTVVASTNGNIPTTAQVDGKTVTLGVNAWIK